MSNSQNRNTQPANTLTPSGSLSIAAFSGRREEANAYIKKIEILIEPHWTENQKIKFFYSGLTGDAMVWAEQQFSDGVELNSVQD
jgi:hypothetical protein